MESERIETAVQRIEQALARIAEIADREPAPPVQDGDVQEESPAAPSAMSPNVSQLVNTHEQLRETVLNEIERLDEVIGALEA